MKRGVMTLDGIITLMLLVFITIWMQNYSLTNLSQINEYGADLQTKSIALDYGSRMNTFYATNPGSSDYLTVDKDLAELFSSDATVIVTKMLGSAKLVTELEAEFGIFTSTYPVTKNVAYDYSAKKVIS